MGIFTYTSHKQDNTYHDVCYTIYKVLDGMIDVPVGSKMNIGSTLMMHQSSILPLGYTLSPGQKLRQEKVSLADGIMLMLPVT